MYDQVKRAVVLLVTLAVAGTAAAHCQIPCGIYDDELRVKLIEEHITTVERSIQQITEIGAAKSPDWNQLVRWVTNKETHAQEIQDIVTAYFMAQRLKYPEGEDQATRARYLEQLTLLHRIQVAAMKSKQSTDLANIATLRSLVGQFRTSYFGPEAGHSH